MKDSVLVLFDRAMIEHDPGEGHPERPDRLRAVEGLLAESDQGVTLGRPREATPQELALVHTRTHVDKILGLHDQFAAIDPDTRVCPQSVRAAKLAAGASVMAIDAMIAGETSRSFVCARPPGHHAEADRAMGFCLFNNIAIAAAHARAKHHVERILIVDWDVHHGNGTQHIFYGDPSVLFCSTHQYPFYPGTGGASEMGSGAGTGKTVNVPMRSGAGDDDYLFAFEEIIEPVAEAFAPQLVLVSAGFDAHRLDPLASMEVTADGFAQMCSAVQGVADRHADGRMALFLEGGYNLEGLTEGVRSCLQIMTGSSDPGMRRNLAPTREREIRAVRDVIERHWSGVLV